MQSSKLQHMVVTWPSAPAIRSAAALSYDLQTPASIMSQPGKQVQVMQSSSGDAIKFR